MWDSRGWTRRLTPRLSVGMVDEWIDTNEGSQARTSCYVAIIQDRDLLKRLGPVRGVPRAGKTLLLFEDDVVALVQYLVDGDLVRPDDEGRVRNGPAEDWQFALQEPKRLRQRPLRRKLGR